MNPTEQIIKIKERQGYILKYCETKKGSKEDFKAEWGTTRCMVGGKTFLMLGFNDEPRPIVTMKLSPENGKNLREKYPKKVIPGYYMNKEHWNSVYIDTPFNKTVLQKMIDESYNLVFNGLTKKAKIEIEKQEKAQQE